MNIYTTQVESGQLKTDPYQLDAIRRLDALRGRVLQSGKSAGGFSGFFKKKAASPPVGLYVWGSVGCGKTMLMDMFHAATPAASLRIHFLEFMQQVHDSLHDVRKSKSRDALVPVAAQLARGCNLLCLDEMQVDDIADGMIIGRLFEKLFEHGVVLCTTSNRPPEDLCKDGLNRHLFLPYIEILKRNVEVYEFGSDRDHRQERMVGEQSYFYPADENTVETMGRIWDDFSGGTSKQLVIKLKGRQIILPEFSNGVLRSHFWNLCGQPLGPSDFLAVANAIRVLILEDVPQLSRTNYNEAKRFVMLVDALYEAGVRLIVSAAAKPEDLYIEGGGSFEFVRAASRLREMQSADWGSGMR